MGYRNDKGDGPPSFSSHLFRSLDPAPILESDSELLRNFVGGRFGSPLEFVPAACLPINFHPADDNQAYRIARSDHHGGRHDHPRGFASGGAERPRPEPAPALRRYGVAFDHCVHFRGSVAESDDEALDGAATLDRDEITANYAVTDLRRRSRPGLHSRKSHPLDIG